MISTSSELSVWLDHISGKRLIPPDFHPGDGFVGSLLYQEAEEQRSHAKAKLKESEEEEGLSEFEKIAGRGHPIQKSVPFEKMLDHPKYSVDIPPETFGTRHFEAMVGFIDMCGFSELASGKSPVEIHQLVTPFIQTVVRCAKKYLAFVDKTMGDEVMVVMPWIEENQALMEVGCRSDRLSPILLTLFFVAELAGQLQTRAPAVTFSSGFAFGSVVLAEVGIDEYNEWTVYGNCVNGAKRLQSCHPHQAAQEHPLTNWTSIGAIEADRLGFPVELNDVLKKIQANESWPFRNPAIIRETFKGVGMMSFLSAGVSAKRLA
jgi:hypothetical protein